MGNVFTGGTARAAQRGKRRTERLTRRTIE